MNAIKIKECDSAIFELREDYLYVRYKDGSIVDLNEAKIQSLIVLELCQGKKVPFIVDFLDISFSVDDESRHYFANIGPHVQLRKSQAILVNNLHSKLISSFYIKFHKPNNPTKLFDTIQDALFWIKSL